MTITVDRIIHHARNRDYMSEIKLESKEVERGSLV